MAVLTVQDVSIAGVVPSYSAANSGGDTFVNDGKTYLHVKTGAGGTLNVTIPAVACDQGTVHNTVVNIANSSEKIIGPFPTNRYGDASSVVSVAYSQVTNVTVGAFQL